MNENRIIEPTHGEIRYINQILDTVVDPYEVLKCNTKSSITDINNNFNELLIENSYQNGGNSGDNDDNSNQFNALVHQININKLNMAYNLLSNKRYREVYDHFFHGSHLKSNLKYLFLYFLKPILNNLSDIVVSPISSGNLIKEILVIFKENNIYGVHDGMVCFMYRDLLKNKIKFPKFRNRRDREKLELLFDYILDFYISLVSFAPTSLSTLKHLEIIYKNKIFFNSGNPLSSSSAVSSFFSSINYGNIKKILITIAYSSAVYFMNVHVEKLFFKFQNYIKLLSKNQPDNQIIGTVDFLFNNFYTSCAIHSLINLSFQLLYIQYPSMLLVSANQFLISSPLNPVSMAIKLFNNQNRSNNIFRILNAFIPRYINIFIYKILDLKKIIIAEDL